MLFYGMIAVRHVVISMERMLQVFPRRNRTYSEQISAKLREVILVYQTSMRLITHNMLRCNVKGVKNGYPLKIEVVKVESVDAEYNPDFVTRMIPKLDWNALVTGAKEVGVEDLPVEVSEDMMSDDVFLRKLHRALLEVRVIEGALICPESGRRFPIQNSIPNMLLNEDEV